VLHLLLSVFYMCTRAQQRACFAAAWRLRGVKSASLSTGKVTVVLVVYIKAWWNVIGLEGRENK
jgi:hypothetical protein